MIPEDIHNDYEHWIAEKGETNEKETENTFED